MSALGRVVLGLGVACALASCQAMQSPEAPEIGMSAAPCLAPLDPKEGGLVVRDLTVLVSAGLPRQPHTARFNACIVSDRYERLALVNLRIGVLRGTPQPLAIDWHGDNGIPGLSSLYGRGPGMPRMVAVVAGTFELPSVEAPFVAAIELTYQLCRAGIADRCVPGELRTRRIAPVRAYHQLDVPIAVSSSQP